MFNNHLEEALMIVDTCNKIDDRWNIEVRHVKENGEEDLAYDLTPYQDASKRAKDRLKLLPEHRMAVVLAEHYPNHVDRKAVLTKVFEKNKQIKIVI